MNQTGNPVPPLSELLTADAIKLQLTSNERQAVLGELVDQIKQIAGQPAARNALVHALEEREQLHSTGIGDGVALPHARNALVGLVDHPILIFGRHDAGLPYGSIDNSPAKLFFLLVAPTVTQHLAVLARLSRLLRDPKLRKSLLGAKSADEVRSFIRDAEAKL